MIHKSSVIDTKAKILNNVKIGPFCYVGPNVILEDNVELVSNVHIEGNTKVGKGTRIFPFASIGTQPQDLKFKGEKNSLEIGENNLIREYVTINPGTEGGGSKTIVGNNCLFMISSHVAHDCKIGNNIVLSHHVALAGHVHIDDYAILSAMVGVVQFRRIGSYSMIGGLCAVDTDILPFTIASGTKGSRAYINGINIVGMKRNGFTKEEINNASEVIKIFFNDTETLKNKIEKFKKNQANKVNEIIKKFLIIETKNGICHPLSNL